MPPIILAVSSKASYTSHTCLCKLLMPDSSVLFLLESLIKAAPSSESLDITSLDNATLYAAEPR